MPAFADRADSANSHYSSDVAFTLTVKAVQTHGRPTTTRGKTQPLKCAPPHAAFDSITPLVRAVENGRRASVSAISTVYVAFGSLWPLSACSLCTRSLNPRNQQVYAC